MIRALRIGTPILVIALALAMFSVTPALAAKGGNGGHNTPSNVGLIVSPNPVQAGGHQYTVTGSGFTANQIVYFMDWCWGASNTLVGGDGTFSLTLTSGFPGTCKFNAYQGTGSQLVLKATTTYTVQ